MTRLANEDGWRQARGLFMRLAIQLHSLKWFTLYAAETAQVSFRFTCKSSISGMGIEETSIQEINPKMDVILMVSIND